ncbi:MAG: DEAD/DEAH box helicase family protein [Synechococcaceae cyanobacterium ELA445]
MASPSFDLGPAPTRGPGSPATVRPRQWQSQLIQLLRRRVSQPDPAGHDVLIHAGPGAGKTLGALLSFQRLRQEGHLSHLLVFCHRSSIASQWHTAAARLGLRLRDWDPEQPQSLGEAGTEEPWQGLLLTYQAAGRHRTALRQALENARLGRVLAIADEVHHLGVDPEEPEACAWGHAFTSLTAHAVLRLGLTGTPFRADNLAFCAARRVRVKDASGVAWRIEPDLSVEPRQLIVAGDVRPLEFRFQDGWVDHGRAGEAAGDQESSPLSAEGRESWRARNLRRAIRLGDSSSIALRLLLAARRRLERVRQEHPEAGGLVIARDIAHARRISGLLEEEGDRVHLVHSQDPEAPRRLAEFQAGEGDWLVSIDMCAEGFDAPRLRVVAYLTTVVTRSRFVQAITRAVRMEDSRSALEAIPRQPSYVFAPADPLLIGYARSWSLVEPYLVRARPDSEEPASGGGSAQSLPLQALADRAGAVLHLKGPQLPGFLQS